MCGDFRLRTHAPVNSTKLRRYAGEHWVHEGENPPVGLILCSQKDESIARYALEGLPNKVMATEYRTTLPGEKLLASEIDRTRHVIELRATVAPMTLGPLTAKLTVRIRNNGRPTRKKAAWRSRERQT